MTYLEIEMTKDEAMGLLESWSDSKMRDVNLRHGASENNLGVNLSKIRGLAKEIKSDPDLGLELRKIDWLGFKVVTAD